MRVIRRSSLFCGRAAPKSNQLVPLESSVYVRQDPTWFSLRVGSKQGVHQRVTQSGYGAATTTTIGAEGGGVGEGGKEEEEAEAPRRGAASSRRKETTALLQDNVRLIRSERNQQSPGWKRRPEDAIRNHITARTLLELLHFVRDAVAAMGAERRA